MITTNMGNFAEVAEEIAYGNVQSISGMNEKQREQLIGAVIDDWSRSDDDVDYLFEIFVGQTDLMRLVLKATLSVKNLDKLLNYILKNRSRLREVVEENILCESTREKYTDIYRRLQETSEDGCYDEEAAEERE